MGLETNWYEWWKQLPRWQYVSDRDIGAYNVFWDYPADFQSEIMPKVFACPKLLDIIVGRFQKVLDSGQFDIDEITLLVRSTGFHVSVPGNACGIDPDSYLAAKGMCGHNIDTSAQAFSLCFLLLTILDEIAQMAALWKTNPDVGIKETETEEKWFTLKRSRRSKPLKLWSVKRFDNCFVGYAYARDHDEAQEIAQERFGADACRITRSFVDQPIGLLPQPKYTYWMKVFLVGGEMKEIKVNAYSEDLAISEAREQFREDEVLDIRIANIKDSED